MRLLDKTLESIKPADEGKKLEAKNYWDSLGKPLGSLGSLEEIGIKLAGITGSLDNKIDKKAIVVMAADNGVFEEGIASSPKEFTKILAENTAKGITGVSTLAKFVGSDVYVVDMGIDGKVYNENIIDRKISNGTRNFTKEKAMEYEEAVRAIEIGIEIGDRLYEEGYDILGTGELGIGNTTTSAAVLSAISGLSVEKTCGVGAGLTREQLQVKLDVIKKALDLHKPDKNDPIDIISKVGGYDIAGMCGVFLSAGKNRKPAVIDGFISQAAALCAIHLKAEVIDYIFPSHLSDEPGSKYMLKELGLEPMLNLKMRLGEGSACPLAFQIIETSLYTQNNLGSFEDLEIDSSILLDMREEE